MSKSVLDGIKIPGYTNRWSSIDEYKVGDKTYYLMENDYWGDETCLLVITPDFKEIYETYDDIETCLTDEGILTESVNEPKETKYVEMDAFENKELTQAIEDIENELADIRKATDVLYDIEEKYVSLKSLKDAFGHLYDAWRTIYSAVGKRNESLNQTNNKFKIKMDAIVESADADDYTISESVENTEIPHLRDVLDRISTIYIHSDVTSSDFNSKGISIVNEDLDDESEEVKLLSLSDDYLMRLPKDKIKTFKNTDLLVRIYKLNKKLLSDEQVKKLSDILSQKVVISKEDVKAFLDKLKECKRLIIADRPENDEFLDKYDLYIDDCLEIIQNLSVEDYYANTRNVTPNYYGDSLIIFEPSNIKLSNGQVFEDLIVYIKIDLDRSQKKAVVALSFHETDHQNKLPYKESLMKEERISPKILEKDEDAYKKLDAVAKSLTKKSPNGYTYYVGDTYLDFGSDYKWTTILVDTSSPLNQFEAGYQALNPLEWEDIVNSNKTADEMADEILADEFCPDKPKEDALKSAMHDLRRI